MAVRIFLKFRNNIIDFTQWVWRGRSGAAATVQTVLSKIFILGINLATGVITARHLGPAGRGELSALILWPQFLAYALTLGLPSALLFNIKRHPEKESELLPAAFLLGSVMSVIAVLMGIIFMPQWLDQYSVKVIYIAQWFMLTAPLTLLWTILIAALEARGDFTTSNQLRYLPSLATMVVLGLLALTHVLTPFTAGMAYLLPGLPMFIWMLAYLRRLFRPRWQNLGAACKRLLSYGLRSYGVDLLGTLALQVDQVLVVGSLSPASMGIYVVALSLSRMLNVFQGALVVVLFPKAAARPVEEVVALVGRAARVSTALTILAGIFVMLLGPELLHLLYGSEFIESVTLVRILIVEVVIGGATSVLAQAFMALGRPGMVTIFQGIGLGLSVPLLLVLIPAYGLVGAGLALLSSTTARLVFVLMSYPLILKVHPPSLLLTREDVYFLQQKLIQKK